MSKPKFKVGDKVRLKKGVKVDDRINGYTICPSMHDDLQKPNFVTKISCFSGSEIYVAKVKGWYVPAACLELVKPEKIIIYRNGAEVVAKNAATGKTGIAKCSPDDEFDFNIGAKLAFERLTNPEPKKPKYYSGKVVCIKNNLGFSTVGRIYNVKDGILDFDGNHTSTSRFTSVEDINTTCLSKYIELVE